MELIKRFTKILGAETYELKYFGLNSKGTFTIVMYDPSNREDFLINFKKEDFNKLKEFILQWEN